jgi:conjugative transfer signal peptidase TraF
MWKSGHLDRGSARVLAAALLALGCVAAVAAVGGVRVNVSRSLPLGVYVRTKDSSAQLVEFCPAEPFAAESSSRGYRTHGTACPDGALPVLKPVVAVAGDRVVLTADGLRVNGRLLQQTAPLYRDAAGRGLRPWPFGSYLVEQGTVWVASTSNRGSYDSRYMGPIRVNQIRARLRPLWIL